MLKRLYLLVYIPFILIANPIAYAMETDNDNNQQQKVSNLKIKHKLRDLPFPDPDTGKLTMLPDRFHESASAKGEILTKAPLSVVFTHVPMIDLCVAAECSSTFCKLVDQTLTRRLGNYVGVDASALTGIPYAAKFKMMCLLESPSRIGHAARACVARHLQEKSQQFIIPGLHATVLSYGCRYIDDYDILQVLNEADKAVQTFNVAQIFQPHHYLLFRHFPSLLTAIAATDAIKYLEQIKNLTVSEVDSLVSALQSDNAIRKGLEITRCLEQVEFVITGTKNPLRYILSVQNRLDHLNSLSSLFPDVLIPNRAQLFRDLCLNLEWINVHDQRKYIDQVKQVVGHAPEHTDLVLKVLSAFNCLSKCEVANELNKEFLHRVDTLLKSDQPFAEKAKLITDESITFLKEKQDFVKHFRSMIPSYSRITVGFNTLF